MHRGRGECNSYRKAMNEKDSSGFTTEAKSINFAQRYQFTLSHLLICQKEGDYHKTTGSTLQS